VDGAPVYLSVGTVRRPHGVRGELLVGLETDRPGAVFRVGRVLTVGDAVGRPLGRQLTVQRARPQQDSMILQVQELASRTQEVEDLRGHTLLIPVAEAAPGDEEEVPYHRLIGLAVVVEGSRIGTVAEVVETAGPELLSVRRTGRKPLLVPFVKEMVRRIDLEGGEIELDPPPGLLEL
jgi:16S rRNA processing protein RimM